jgi:hypothetical protein
MGCTYIKKDRQIEYNNRNPVVRYDPNIQIYDFCINDVVEPSTHLFKCTINTAVPAIAQIFHSEFVDTSILETYSKLSTDYPSFFIPIQLHDNGRFVYIILKNVFTNLETLLYNKVKYNEIELRKIALMLLNCTKILNEKYMLHKNINCCNIYRAKHGDYHLGVGDIFKCSPIMKLLYHKQNQDIIPNGLANENPNCDLWSIGTTLIRIIIGVNYENIPSLQHFTDAIEKPSILEEVKSVVTDECFDFLTKILQADPIKLDEAFKHGWLHSSKVGNSFPPQRNQYSTQVNAVKLIHEVASTLIKIPKQVDGMFKKNWEIDNDVFQSLIESENPHIEQIKCGVINCLKLYKEELLYREYIELMPDPINDLELVKKRVPSSYGTQKEITESYITESFSFMEFIELRRAHKTYEMIDVFRQDPNDNAKERNLLNPAKDNELNEKI